MKLLISLLLLTLPLASYGQTKKPDPTPTAQKADAPAAKPVKFVACKDEADASGLTECERQLIELINLQAAPLQQKLQELQAQFGRLVAAFEAEHPGMKYQAPSGEFPSGRLVVPPAPKPTPPPPAATTAPTAPTPKTP
jgi:hypothetical protein